MTNASLTRNLNAARKTITSSGPRSERRERMVSALLTLNAIAAGAWELGRDAEVDAVSADIRAELAWLDDCSKARNALGPAPKPTGFAAELAVARSMGAL
jgi:hypothetical protein